MWILWLAACGPEQTKQPEPPPERIPETSTTTSWTAPETVAPTFDAAALGEGLQAAIEMAWTIDPKPIFDIYNDLMGYDDGYCPYSYSYATTYGGEADSWYAQCDSYDGATYSGYAYHYFNEGDSDSYESLYMSATIISPDDALFSVQGGFESGMSTYGNTVYGYVNLDGFAESDGEVLPDWLGDGVRPSLYAERNYQKNGQWKYIYADGQLAGLPGTPVDTVDLQVELDSSDGCAEPDGVISLRSSSGDWFEVTFEGVAGTCDGCGLARWRGLEMGTVCGDFSPWMNEEGP